MVAHERLTESRVTMGSPAFLDLNGRCVLLEHFNNNFLIRQHKKSLKIYILRILSEKSNLNGIELLIGSINILFLVE